MVIFEVGQRFQNWMGRVLSARAPWRWIEGGGGERCRRRLRVRGYVRREVRTVFVRRLKSESASREG